MAARAPVFDREIIGRWQSRERCVQRVELACIMPDRCRKVREVVDPSGGDDGGGSGRTGGNEEDAKEVG